MTGATLTRPQTPLADLATRLTRLGLLDRVPDLAGAPDYQGVTWSLEPTRPGDLHINLLGAKRAPAAVRRAVLDGAVAVCWSKPNAELVEELRAQGVPVLEVNDERRAMSLSSALLHGFPSKDIAMIGITGTNAKTTCTLMTAACLHRSGMSSAFSCSELAGIDHATTKPTLTTPDAPELQRWLGEVRDSGSTTAVLEVSSQAISDARVADVAVGIAVCTTIGVDHLDVHGSEAGYRAVKRSLFEGLGPDGVAVFHGDDAAVVEVAAGTGAIDIPVGRSPGSVARITDDALHFGPEFARLTGRPQAIVPITNPLLRAHVLTNAALAATAALVAGANPAGVEAGLAGYAGLPRRLQVVTRHPFTLVDDMCNPLSVANTLEDALAPLRRDARRFLAGISVRGNRGIPMNAQLGEMLGGILVRLDVDEVHVTRNEDFVGPVDWATDAEEQALLGALRSWGLEVTVYREIRPLVEALHRSLRRDDLALLIGPHRPAPGVDMLRELLAGDGRRGRRALTNFAPSADELLARAAGRSSASITKPTDRIGNRP